MWTWILLIPIIILFNSFAIGKIYKRFNVYLSSYSCYSFGMITFFGLFGLILIPLMLFGVNFKLVLIVYLIAQCILVVLYALNWRWFFISYKINFKKLCLWLGVAILAFGGFLITRTFSDLEPSNINWFLDGKFDYLLKFSVPSATTIQIFTFPGNYLATEFIYIFYAIFVYLFQIQDFNTLQLFYTYITLFIFTILTSTSLMSIFIKKGTQLEFNKILVLLLTTLLISVISFVIPNFLWIIIFTILLVDTHSLRENQFSSDAAIYMINFIVFSATAFNINFLLIALVINLIHTFLSFQARKEKCFNYNILTLFATFLMLAMSFDNTYYVGFISLVSILIIYTFYLFYKSSNIANKINSVIDNFLYEYINFIIITIIGIITIVSLIYFLTSGNFLIATDVWLLKTIGSPAQTMKLDSPQYVYINVFYAIINVFIFLAALINSGMINLNKYGKVFRLKNEMRILSSQFNLSIFVILIFWNPISTNLYNQLIKIQNVIGFEPNFQVIFAAMMVPCFLAMSKHFFNSTKFGFTGYTFLGIISAVSGLLVLGINLC